MNNSKTIAEEMTARIGQVARLLYVLELAFDRAALITLECGAMDEKEAKNAMRALIWRANQRAGGALRYVVVREYDAQRGRVIAYHVFCNLPGAECADACKRWGLGDCTIREVNPKDRATLPPAILAPDAARAGRRMFDTSKNIWQTVAAS